MCSVSRSDALSYTSADHNHVETGGNQRAHVVCRKAWNITSAGLRPCRSESSLGSNCRATSASRWTTED